MAEKLEAENASWERTAKDLSAGAAGGIAQVLLGKYCTMLFSSLWEHLCIFFLHVIQSEKLLYVM